MQGQRPQLQAYAQRAGYDALEIGQVLLTVMLFVPSKDGRSNCPVEFTKYSDFAHASVIMAELAEKLLMN